MESSRREEFELEEEEEQNSGLGWRPPIDGGNNNTIRFLIHPQNW